MAGFLKNFPRINMKEAAAIMKASKDAITSFEAQARRYAKDGLLKTEETLYKWEDYKESNRRVKLLCTLGSAVAAGQSYWEMEKMKNHLNAIELAHAMHNQIMEKRLKLTDQAHKEEMDQLESKMVLAHKEEMDQLESKMDLKMKLMGEEMERLKQELLARQDVNVKEVERLLVQRDVQVKEVERLLVQQPKPLVEQLKPFSRLIAKSREDTHLHEAHRRELGLAPPYGMMAPDFSAPKSLALAAKGK